MKKYIQPSIYTIEIDTAAIMAASETITISTDGSGDATGPEYFAAPDFRTTLWGD